MKKAAAEYEAPSLTVLGTVAELTQLDQPGPNPDAAGFSPSVPVP